MFFFTDISPNGAKIAVSDSYFAVTFRRLVQSMDIRKFSKLGQELDLYILSTARPQNVGFWPTEDERQKCRKLFFVRVFCLSHCLTTN